MVYQQDRFVPLCEDVLVNIFCRLRERDLLKCKCVSKEWHIIVSHVCVPRLSDREPFSGVYFRVARDDKVPFALTRISPEFKDQLHLLMAYKDSIHYIGTASLKPPIKLLKAVAFDAACSVEMALASLLPFDHRGPDFLDCCNGLVLFVQPPKAQFFVCNPTIRQCVPVLPPPPSMQLSSLYASLAFDPSESIEYRVVISTLTTERQCLHVFYSQSGNWKTHELQIELPTAAKSFKLVRYSVYLKNVVYRLSMFSKILCFDLKSMKALVLNCPSKKSPPTHLTDTKDQPPPGCIGVSNGRLSYMTDEEGYVCVWSLDTPNESCEWSLKYTICSCYLWEQVSNDVMRGRLGWLRYCGFHPTSDVLFFSSATSMFIYHRESGKLERVRYLFGRGVMHCGFFFPIFLHKNMFVTLKNWCRAITPKIEDCKEIQDRWCYIED